MDIQAEKLNLIKWLTDVTEPSVIESFLELNNKQQVDWWDEIGDDEKREIEAGLNEADKDEFILHDVVTSKYDKWRSK